MKETIHLCCPDRYNDWLGENIDLNDPDLMALLFLDQCIHSVLENSKQNLKPGIKILNFPDSLKGCSDYVVFGSVLAFIKNNPILSKKKILFYFYTNDKRFISSSRANTQMRQSLIYIFFNFFKQIQRSKKDGKNRKITKSPQSLTIIRTINEDVYGK